MLPAASAVIVSCVRTYARWRLITWIFESLQKPAVLKKTLSGMLHLFDPLRKPTAASPPASPPETPDTSEKAPKVAAIGEFRNSRPSAKTNHNHRPNPRPARHVKSESLRRRIRPVRSAAWREGSARTHSYSQSSNAGLKSPSKTSVQFFSDDVGEKGMMTNARLRCIFLSYATPKLRQNVSSFGVNHDRNHLVPGGARYKYPLTLQGSYEKRQTLGDGRSNGSVIARVRLCWFAANG